VIDIADLLARLSSSARLRLKSPKLTLKPRTWAATLPGNRTGALAGIPPLEALVDLEPGQARITCRWLVGKRTTTNVPGFACRISIRQHQAENHSGSYGRMPWRGWFSPAT